MESSVILFADGASSGNPGPGGWGTILYNPNAPVSLQVQELGGKDPQTTNNKMELAAVIEGLSRIAPNNTLPIQVYTDSVYVIRGITAWVWGWRAKGWKTAEGKDVANQEYWQELLRITMRVGGKNKIKWHFVRGHAGIPGNERVDEIAVAMSKGGWIDLYKGPLLKYPVAFMDIPEDTSVPAAKPIDKSPKAQAYSYLSLVGNIAKRHKTWKECEARIKGVPRARFKKAMSPDEDEKILSDWGVRVLD